MDLVAAAGPRLLKRGPGTRTGGSSDLALVGDAGGNGRWGDWFVVPFVAPPPPCDLYPHLSRENLSLPWRAWPTPVYSTPFTCFRKSTCLMKFSVPLWINFRNEARSNFQTSEWASFAQTISGNTWSIGSMGAVLLFHFRLRRQRMHATRDAYSLRPKINVFLKPNTETNVWCEITKILLIFCEKSPNIVLSFL